MRIAVLLLALPVAGCFTLSEAPVAARSYPIAYDRLGACVYQRLDAVYPGNVKMADLRAAGSIRLSMTAETGPLWDMTIIKNGPRSSTVTVKETATLGGADWHTRTNLMPAVQSCAV